MVWCVTGDLIPENCVEFFRALNNGGLKVSNLNVQNLTDQTAEHFAVGLAKSQLVQAVELTNCKITSAGAVSIVRSVEHNTSLEELDLSMNRQLAEGDSEAVGCAIERMLNVNRTLKVLNLHGYRLDKMLGILITTGPTDNIGWKHMFKALCNNTTLKKLDISENKLRVEGSVAVAEMLSCNKSLTELKLEWCHIPEAGLREIARGLLQNTSLQVLKLDKTQQKTFLEAEIERLKKSGIFKSQSLSRLEIKTGWW